MGANFGIGMALGKGIVGMFGSNSSYNGMYDYNPMSGPMAMYQQAVDQEALLNERQGRVALDEANAAAIQTAREGKRVREQQAVDYTNSGVLLEGTPIEVLNDTVARTGEEIDAIMKRGSAQAELFNRRANITRNQGRASLLGEQAQFNTRRAQAMIASINGNSPFGNALFEIGSALSSNQGGVSLFKKPSSNISSFGNSSGFGINYGSAGGPQTIHGYM